MDPESAIIKDMATTASPNGGTYIYRATNNLGHGIAPAKSSKG